MKYWKSAKAAPERQDTEEGTTDQARHSTEKVQHSVQYSSSPPENHIN